MPTNGLQPDRICPEDIFTCTRCGDCCKGYGGTYISDRQLRIIADYLGMDLQHFVEEKCQSSGGKLLLAQKEDGYCVFWDGLCTIYPVRPDMCRKWPFIEGVLQDVNNWHIMAASCPGMRTDVPDDVIRDCVEEKLREFQLFSSGKLNLHQVKIL
jgi:Fe-S-cluster containining protein